MSLLSIDGFSHFNRTKRLRELRGNLLYFLSFRCRRLQSRETHALHLFIALRVHEDVWAPSPTSLPMPRAPLEGLVREYGVMEGVLPVR
ncbi:hypothetical protein K438DRAFT_1978045 [Mycena galopus ATCC 62051]|nr:hypothetical protein K438DRAFT_1978045 [Mycena galopus ATCC 62051]